MKKIVIRYQDKETGLTLYVAAIAKNEFKGFSNFADSNVIDFADNKEYGEAVWNAFKYNPKYKNIELVEINIDENKLKKVWY